MCLIQTTNDAPLGHQWLAKSSIHSRARRTSVWPLKSSSPEATPKKWRLFSSLIARLTRFAKRESWSFGGCSLALLSWSDRLIFERRSSASDRVSLPDLLSLFSRLSPPNRGVCSGVNITLSAPTFRALKNIMDKTGLLDFLARGSHFNIASDAERIVFRWLDHARASPGSGSRFYVRSLA